MSEKYSDAEKVLEVMNQMNDEECDELATSSGSEIDEVLTVVEYDSDNSEVDPNFESDRFIDESLRNINNLDILPQSEISAANPHADEVRNIKPNFFDECDPAVIYPGKNHLRGKNGHKWSSIPFTSKHTRTSAKNIIHIVQGPDNNAKNATTFRDYFSLFFTESMIDSILKYTNEEILRRQQNYNEKKATSTEMSKEQFYAMLGCLLLSATMNNNHLPTREMFDPTISGMRYRACMSCDRFEFLINNLRFDDKLTRNKRRESDKFAPIRDLWTSFTNNCKQNYKPGSYITIDEQLLGFRGRCPFRMYIPNKPDKYGIKLVMICDVRTKYMINASPYLGKHTNTSGLKLADYYVKDLTKSIYGSNRNITMDNWFTSVPLASELLKKPYNLTIVGTIRKNKREIPQELLVTKGRNIGSSMFCFDKEKTLVSYKTKSTRNVLLLSTTHEFPNVNPISKKPEIIEFYNDTKGAVDTLDEMCKKMSTSRKTRRWPLCLFYGMLNITMVNAYVIYCHNTIKNNSKPCSRREFVKQMSYELMEPFLKQRIEVPTLSRYLKEMIRDILEINPTPQPETSSEIRKRKICSFCPSAKRRMTRYVCNTCQKYMCQDHRGMICSMCSNNKY